MSAEAKLSTRETILQKSNFYRTIRDFFYARKVSEVVTSPFRKAPPTDVFLDHFECKAFNDPEIFYMHSSPEYAMKQLLTKGSGDIFQLCQVARGNEKGAWHSKAFSMLEWYRIDKEINFLIKETTDLMAKLLGHTIKPIIISYQQSYAQFANIANIYETDAKELEYFCLQKQLAFGSNWQKDDYLYLIMDRIIEPEFSNLPLVVVYDFPESQAALAKTYTNNNGNKVADRFEVYCYGIEVGNGYNELTCPEQHLKRFQQDQDIRAKMNKPRYKLDQDFIDDLINYGMPNSVGIAMGLDRIFAISIDAKRLIL